MITPNLVLAHQRFGEIYCLHRQCINDEGTNKPDYPASTQNKTLWKLLASRTWCSYTSGYEKFYLLGCITVWAVEIQPTFLFGLFFDHEDGGDMFLRNLGWISTFYTALYHRRQNMFPAEQIMPMTQSWIVAQNITLTSTDFMWNVLCWHGEYLIERPSKIYVLPCLWITDLYLLQMDIRLPSYEEVSKYTHLHHTFYFQTLQTSHRSGAECLEAASVSVTTGKHALPQSSVYAQW
jgi:hypothetical protein